ncbi:PQQ-binding-like beta-propeller repeat protein [Streptomyces sp. NPDC057496]|uniref:outer membrane protein assembly factor BamB family protein n=1 Tax=Streptomyces sp. NPDC057496 TaxID=3346149 RepID=UPI0036B439B1
MDIPAPLRTGDAVLFHERGKKHRVDLVLRSARTEQERWRIPLSKITTAPDGILDQVPPVAPSRAPPSCSPASKASAAAVDVRTGKQKWTFKGEADFMDRKRGPVSTPNGFVLVTPDGVVCLGAEDGTERWRTKGGEDLHINSAGNYTMVSHSHTVRLFQQRETVRVFHSTDGRVLWQGELESSFIFHNAPLAAGRMLAFLNPSETLRAIRLTG